MTFQSLIWVACPTGYRSASRSGRKLASFNPSYGLHALRAPQYPSGVRSSTGFNPSYGLHALRAPLVKLRSTLIANRSVSIPHMGCMPYGRGTRTLPGGSRWVSIPHMGCMPYGLLAGLPAELPEGFQSLIWVACPTGFSAAIHHDVRDPVSIPHMGCMPYGLVMGAYDYV